MRKNKKMSAVRRSIQITKADIRIQVGDVCYYIHVGSRYIQGHGGLGRRAEERVVGMGIDELRSVGLHCQSIMQAELNWLFMRRIGTFIDAGCHQLFT